MYEEYKLPAEFIIPQIRPGTTTLLTTKDGSIFGWGYGNGCPFCGSENLRDKGGYEKCMDCGVRINFQHMVGKKVIVTLED